MYINCKKIYQEMKLKLNNQILETNKHPIIGIISFSKNKDSEVYIKGICKLANELGIHVVIKSFDFYTITQREFDDYLQSESSKIHECDGVILQLPIPDHISIKVFKSLYKWKDIDGFIDNSPFIPATAKGILLTLDYLELDYRGKNCVIIGRSKYIGRAIAKELLNKDCTTTICHSFTNDLSYYTKHADIIISAVGKPNLIQLDMVKQDSIIIDIGISVIDNKIYGDVSKDCAILANITPVPNGMGLMTRIALIDNLLHTKNQIVN